MAMHNPGPTILKALSSIAIYLHWEKYLGLSYAPENDNHTSYVHWLWVLGSVIEAQYNYEG